MDRVRELALKTIYKIEQDNAYSNIVLDEVLKSNKNKLDSRDIGLISELIYGVTSWKITLDEIIKKYSKIKIKKISPWILNILRMGVYQIVFLDKIPKSAAVNESVKLAKKYGHRRAVGFTNAVLRKVEKEDYNELFGIKDAATRISVTTSMPIWIVKKLLEEQTEKDVEKICINSNLRPKLTIRINYLKTNNAEIKALLQERNIEFEETTFEDFLILKNQKNIKNLDLFKNGFFTVQDLSAGLVAKVLSPKFNDKILDACAAPGGKTTHIAEIIQNCGAIEAWDIHSNRNNLIIQNAQRLGINIINTKIQDATKENKDYIEKFDKVLLDVPCLGLGVIKRKPDIKWQRKPEDIEKIASIQFKILETCSKYVKNGGVLVYSTCSILQEENQKNIEKFLQQNNEFKISNYEEVIDCENIKKFIQNSKYIQINPSSKFDGFFICKLAKK